MYLGVTRMPGKSYRRWSLLVCLCDVSRALINSFFVVGFGAKTIKARCRRSTGISVPVCVRVCVCACACVRAGGRECECVCVCVGGGGISVCVWERERVCVCMTHRHRVQMWRHLTASVQPASCRLSMNVNIICRFLSIIHLSSRMQMLPHFLVCLFFALYK